MGMQFKLRWRSLLWVLPWFINLAVMLWIDAQPGWRDWQPWILDPSRIAMTALFIVLPFVAIGGLFGRGKLGLQIGLLVAASIILVVCTFMKLVGPPP
jgi:hypothetical protein